MIHVIPGVYTDEDVSPVLAELLRKEGIDAVCSHDVGMNGKNDEEQLLFAVTHSRICIVFNKKDYLELAKRIPHTGMIVCPQVPINAYARLVDGIIDKLTLVGDWENIVVWASM